MRLILDAGAFVAIERGDRELLVRLRRERIAGREALTHGGVLGQVWRGGARQAQLARAVPLVRVVPLDMNLGRRAGELLGRAGGRDVIDAAVVLLAVDHDRILTSDPADIAALVRSTGRDIDITPI